MPKKDKPSTTEPDPSIFDLDHDDPLAAAEAFGRHLWGEGRFMLSVSLSNGGIVVGPLLAHNGHLAMIGPDPEVEGAQCTVVRRSAVVDATAFPVAKEEK